MCDEEMSTVLELNKHFVACVGEEKLFRVRKHSVIIVRVSVFAFNFVFLQCGI